jgi:hypothetical protein
MHSDIIESVKESLPTESEKNLLAGLEAKYAALHRQLKEASAERERVLLAQLAAARYQLFVVVLLAILSIAAVFSFRAAPKEGLSPASSRSAQVAAPVAVPAAFVLEATIPVPASVPVAGAPAVVKGNGGNFSGGSSSVKK